MTPAHASPSSLTLLTGLALLGPLGVLVWQSPRLAPSPQEEDSQESVSAPPPAMPAAPAVARSSLLVAKLKEPAAEPARDEALSDAPREVEGVLTGTLAEIEARVARESSRVSESSRPARARARKSPARKLRTAARGLPRCVSECRAERTLCVERRRGAVCRAAYTECAAACRADFSGN